MGTLSGVPYTIPEGGQLYFGPIPAGGSAPSLNRFVIERRTSTPLTARVLAQLPWSIARNTPPVANAGPDQRVSVGKIATLDGSASTDADGNRLRFYWRIIKKPSRSRAALSNRHAVRPRFTLDLAGEYQIRLKVRDDMVSSIADIVIVSTDNLPPVADAGLDQTAAPGDTVFLDGGGSTDPNGDPLTYSWTLQAPPGSGAQLLDPALTNPSFQVDLRGTYTGSLIVNDGKVTSAPDTVTISMVNTPPVADAGPNQSVVVNQLLTLEGSGSTDVDGDSLTYAWSIANQPPGSNLILDPTPTPSPTRTITPRIKGDYLLQLIVNDGTVNSAPATVTITTRNSAPVAAAGQPQSVFVNQIVTLDGAGSTDVDGDALTYAWSILSQPLGSNITLDPTPTSSPTRQFTSLVKGDYIFQFIVNDGTVDSAAATVTITTENSKPVANAGAPQTVAVNTPITLDGSNSTDADGDPLTYAWSIVTQPPGGNLSFNPASTSDPVRSFTPLVKGDYVFQLIVNDGTLDSAPVTVVITTQNSKPVAEAGLDQTVTIGQPSILDGSNSQDADGDPLSYSWSLLAQPPGSSLTLDPTPSTSAIRNFTPLTVGDYVAQLIVNDATLDSDPDTVTITGNPVVPPPNQNPQITSTPVRTGQVNSPYSYDVEGQDPDLGDMLIYALTVFPNGMLIDQNTGLITWTPSAAGNFDVTVQVSDGRGGVTQTFIINVAAAPIAVPDVIGLAEAQAFTHITNAGLTVGSITQANSDTVTAGNVISQNPAAATAVAAGSAVDFVVSQGPVGGGGGLPPDPVTVAPPVEAGVATVLSESTEFLYSGPNPIQTGVAPGTIEAKRAAVLRGRVLDKNNQPLSGVTITVLNHPELGQTLSRADGMFDMAVNGGGLVSVNYAKDGFLPAQRQANAPWQDFEVIEDIVMIAKDPKVTTIDFNASTAMQAAQGSAVTDADGRRTATVLIPQGTNAQVYLPDGTTQSVSTLNLRFTEYTVGPNGPATMPAPLPATSAYTYAVELGADEATTKIAGKDVLLSQPVYFYLENFLGFPTGIQVPVGYYDKDKAAWIPSPDGRIIKMLSIAGGIADLDTDGDGAVDDGAAIGVTEAERRQLASLYTAGQSLERIPITHFSTYDPNYGTGCKTQPCDPPKNKKPETPNKKIPKDKNCSSGSIIECETQVLGETIDIVGTPFTLNYRSDRVPGRKTANTLEIPLSGPTIAPSLFSIVLEINVAGQIYKKPFLPQPNLNYTYVWDGKDAYGRDVRGSQKVSIRIGYVYPAVYNRPPAIPASFGVNSGQPLPTSIPARQPLILWQEQTASLGHWDARTNELGVDRPLSYESRS